MEPAYPGGTAPTPEEAEKLDLEEAEARKAAREERERKEGLLTRAARPPPGRSGAPNWLGVIPPEGWIIDS